MKNLAQKTAASTAEIQQIIQRLPERCQRRAQRDDRQRRQRAQHSIERSVEATRMLRVHRRGGGPRSTTERRYRPARTGTDRSFRFHTARRPKCCSRTLKQPPMGPSHRTPRRKLVSTGDHLRARRPNSAFNLLRASLRTTARVRFGHLPGQHLCIALEQGEALINGFGTVGVTHLGGEDDGRSYGISGQTNDSRRGDQLSKFGAQADLRRHRHRRPDPADHRQGLWRRVEGGNLEGPACRGRHRQPDDALRPPVRRCTCTRKASTWASATLAAPAGRGLQPGPASSNYEGADIVCNLPLSFATCPSSWPVASPRTATTTSMTKSSTSTTTTSSVPA